MLWTRCRPRHPKKQARHDTLFMVPSCIVLSHSLVHVAEALLSWVENSSGLLLFPVLFMSRSLAAHNAFGLLPCMHELTGVLLHGWHQHLPEECLLVRRQLGDALVVAEGSLHSERNLMKSF